MTRIAATVLRPLATALCALALAATSFAAQPVATPSASDDIAPTLIALEKQSWAAWKSHDGAFFASFLSDDHVDIATTGVSDKKNVVAGVAGPFCNVDNYEVDRFRVTRLTIDTAIVVYHAQQKTLCGKTAVPSPTWVSSLYVRRGGRWLNAVFQQTPTER